MIYLNFVAKVLLPYRFTLFSNRGIDMLDVRLVLLPYRFTLFSNDIYSPCYIYTVLLPYRFTLFSNNSIVLKFYFEFYYLIDLHYSQTKLIDEWILNGFTTL